MDADKVYQTIRQEKIIAIVRGLSSGQILNVAKSLCAGGIKMMEITCNTAGFAEMIAMVSEQMGRQMIIGAGTVINKQLCSEASSAGAEYIIAPDVNPEVIEYCLAKDLAVLPGAATATEVLDAARLGVKMVKIFPARPLGPDYIRMLRGPIDNVDFVAVGGIRLDNIENFLAAGCTAVGVGTGAITQHLLQQSDWASITALAAKYKSKVTVTQQ